MLSFEKRNQEAGSSPRKPQRAASNRLQKLTSLHSPLLGTRYELHSFGHVSKLFVERAPSMLIRSASRWAYFHRARSISFSTYRQPLPIS